MLELLRQASERSSQGFGVATVEDLSNFNHVSNIRGQVFRVLVADAVQCSEGISFLAVRRAFLTDVPQLHSQFVQMCGRSIRMFGHRGLPKEEQQVVTQLYIASLPKWMSSPLSCWAFRAQKRSKTGKVAESDARILLQRLQTKGIGNLEQLKEKLARLNGRQDVSSSSMRLDPERVRGFLASIGHMDCPSDSDEADPCSEKARTKAFPHKSGALMRAANHLNEAVSIDDATLALAPTTADEDALQDLVRQSQDLAGTLVKMRTWAVDKNVLECLGTFTGHTIVTASSSGITDSTTTSSIVPHSGVDHHDHAENIKPLRRLRSKTSFDALRRCMGGLGPAAQDGDVQVLPLCDMPSSDVHENHHTAPNSQVKHDVQILTKKKEVVETPREIVEVATVVYKRVRRK
jgi:hypothetical protein